MSKYADQYKSPKWQQLRLRKFEAAGFECSNCGDTEGQLHLHHKRYIKGRDVWDYEDSEMAVLCDNCHEGAHLHLRAIDEILSLVSVSQLYELSSILAGIYIEDDSYLYQLFDECGEQIGLHAGRALKKRLLPMDFRTLLQFEEGSDGSI